MKGEKAEKGGESVQEEELEWWGEEGGEGKRNYNRNV